MTHGAWPTEGLSFGGDYNPEQWPREIWREDVALMREAGVNLVTLGVFSWGLVEIDDGRFDWEWFDEIVELLHENGIGIDLATPTAAPPSWLLAKHPELLPVDADGHRQAPGGRLGWCPSSPVFRRYAERIADALGERYGKHPAVRMWHVSNELGGGNGRCYCDESAAAFRSWLERKYGGLDELNAAWGTSFWGHRYTDFEQIMPPRGSTAAHSPALQLDFERFSSDELLEHFRAERSVLARHTDRPITTNLMVNTGDVVDYPRWARELPIVANDHYVIGADPHREQELAFADDRMRGIARDRGPWMMMEHSTSAVAWQPVNRAKAPRELLRNSLVHVARGADAAMFFQWRASAAGAEQFHSAMVPHAGRDSKVFREVVELGSALRRLAEVQGSTVERAKVAVLWDTEADWALRRGLKPRRSMSYSDEPRRWHRAFWRRNILVDVVPPWADLDAYDLVVVPTLFLVSDEDAARIAAAAERGATVVVGYLSGIVDPDDRVRLGGYPGAFRELLGVSSEEFFPLMTDEQVELDTGWRVREWSELLTTTDAEVVAGYANGPLSGSPAISRRHTGNGSAWYVSAGLEEDGVAALLDRLIEGTGVAPVLPAAEGVEVVRRVGDAASWLFVVNHGSEDEELTVTGHELLTDEPVDGRLVVPAGEVRVIRE